MILMTFGVMMHLSPLSLKGNQKFENFKIKRVEGDHFGNKKIPYLINRLANFDEILHDGLLLAARVIVYMPW